MINVAIVGVGLIGGSLGLSLGRVKRKGIRTYKIFGMGRQASRLKQAARLGAVDVYSVNPQKIIPQADVVILAVPVDQIADVFRKIKPFLAKTAVVSDVGSVKAPVLASIKKQIGVRRDIQFVGAHPIAGLEKSGVENSKANLFEKSICVVTTDGAGARSSTVISRLWKDAGASIVKMTAKNHDEVLAVTSHLPHLISYALFEYARSKKPEFLKLSGGSFKDLTRIAASDSVLWTAIFKQNQIFIDKAAREFTKIFQRLSHIRGASLSKKLRLISQAKRKSI